MNSLGDTGDRARYVDALAAYFRSHEVELSQESRATLARNPLRVLDSKRAEDRDVVAQAPSISEFFSPEAAAHFAAVQEGLALLGIDFVVNDRLVRGLDYYRSTTFEFVSTALDAAQTAVGGEAATTGSSRTSAENPLPASALRSESTARCLPVMRNPRFPPPMGQPMCSLSTPPVAVRLFDWLHNCAGQGCVPNGHTAQRA